MHDISIADYYYYWQMSKKIIVTVPITEFKAMMTEFHHISASGTQACKNVMRSAAMPAVTYFPFFIHSTGMFYTDIKELMALEQVENFSCAPIT